MMNLVMKMAKRSADKVNDTKVNEPNLNKEIKLFDGVVVRYGFSDLQYNDGSLLYHLNLYEAIIGSNHACLVVSESFLPDFVKDAVMNRASMISTTVFFIRTLKEARNFFIKLSVM